jgi:hypothetical protein
MRLASRPRPTRLPAHSGSDWTDAMRMPAFGQPSRAGTSASLVPVQCPRGRVRRPRWTPRSDRFRTAHARPCPAGHRPLHRARQPNRKRCGQGTDERHGRHSDILDRHDHKAARRDTPSPLLWGRRLRLGNQGRLRDGNTASATVTTAVTRQLLGVAPRSKPRLGALLSSDDSGRA